MWRDDGTRSAVKQSYRRVTVLVHGIHSLLSFLSPAKLPSHRARGWMGGGGAWEVVPVRPSCSPCSVVNLLFHVLGEAILITNYIMHVPLAEEA